MDEDDMTMGPTANVRPVITVQWPERESDREDNSTNSGTSFLTSSGLEPEAPCKVATGPTRLQYSSSPGHVTQEVLGKLLVGCSRVFVNINAHIDTAHVFERRCGSRLRRLIHEVTHQMDQKRSVDLIK
jgi:hypothetical protein